MSKAFHSSNHPSRETLRSFTATQSGRKREQPVNQSPPLNLNTDTWSWWARFWHAPVRAERLALVRVMFAFALLTDQLFQYLPNLEYFFGSTGVAPAGVNDGYLLRSWRWPILIFYTDNMTVIGGTFAAWVAATVMMLLGWRTRLAVFLVWFGTMCFTTRNPNLKNGGDDTLQLALFLLLISPCGAALSLDYLRRKRKALRGLTHTTGVRPLPDSLARPTIMPWAVRLFQLQLCVIYCSTGIAKLRGHTWWYGTSVHNVLNDVTMSRWSYAQVPLPFWVTAPLTYATLFFEVFFPLLVLFRVTRKWALWGGILFHLGIYATIEVGWFSFYSIAMYGVWMSDEWWDRFTSRRQPTAKTQQVTKPAV